jgi:hypothetical protein
MDLDKDKVKNKDKDNDLNLEKMQEKIQKIYKKKKTNTYGYTRTFVKPEFLPTIYEMPAPVTFGSIVEESEKEGKEGKEGMQMKEGKEGMQTKEGMKNKKKDKNPLAAADPANMAQTILPIKETTDKIHSDFIELAKVIGYNDIYNKTLPYDKSLDQVWNENSLWLQNVLFEFILVFISYIITYNIYYFSFIYHWEVSTAHFDPKQGFLFGGVLKSFMDDWLMRDIRYPMLFMGYLYSWLIPAFFNFIGVIHYPKLCFLIILLHTMIITFTQGPNAAMSLDSLLSGSPSVLILLLNIASCFGAFFNSSMTAENALAWARFTTLFLSSCVSNILRILIAFFGVFISQIMVYLFFFYTTSGFGLLWEASFVNIGEKIAEINAHINGNSGVGKNYCKDGKDTVGLWAFINRQVEPHFSWIFIYLLMLYIIVKTIATFFVYNGTSARLFLCYFLIILGIIVWLIATSITGTGSANANALTTVFVSSKEPKKSMFERAKEGVQGLSDYRKRTLTNLSNQGEKYLSKTVGQTARNASNFASNNIMGLFGDDTFTALDKKDRATLEQVTMALNDIVNNIDSVADNASGGEETKQVEADIRLLLENNKDIYDLLANIFSQPKIQTYIESKIAKGKSLPNILSSMFQYILSRAGANEKVSALVSSIMANMDYGADLEIPEITATAPPLTSTAPPPPAPPSTPPPPLTPTTDNEESLIPSSSLDGEALTPPPAPPSSPSPPSSPPNIITKYVKEMSEERKTREEKERETKEEKSETREEPIST